MLLGYLRNLVWSPFCIIDTVLRGIARLLQGANAEAPAARVATMAAMNFMVRSDGTAAG